MAKASKKADSAEQGPSRNGGGRGVSAAGRKSAPKGAQARSTPESRDRALVVDAVTIEALAERIEPSAPSTSDSAVSSVALADAGAEVRALCESIRSARSEAAELLTGLRSEVAAALAELIELRHQCRQTGEKLVLEIGEQSLALTRVRQAREETEELARGTEEARADIRALREECARATAALGALAEQSQTAFQESRDEVLEGVRHLRQEIESVRDEPPAPSAPVEPDSSVPEETLTPTVRSEDRKNRFGVTVAPAVVVTEVLAGSPAAGAAFVLGDVIEEANGRPVQSGTDLRDAVSVIPDGETVTLQLRRGEARLVRSVRLGNGTAESKNRLGVTVAPRLLVADVFAGSPAQAAGLARGDVIEDAHGQPVQTCEQFLSIIHAQPEGAEVMLVVTRNGERHEFLTHLDHP